MKHRIIFLLGIVIGLMGLFVPQFTVTAQNAAVKCGDIIKGDLTKEKQLQSYPIVLSPGDKVTFAGQADGTSQLQFGMALDSPAGFRIFPDRHASIDTKSSPFLKTGRMPAYGLYTLYVFNNDKVGAYQISIGCELADGTIIAAGDTYTPRNTGRPKTVTLPLTLIQGNALNQLQCGDVVASEFTQNQEIHTYTLEMAAGDVSFQINATLFGDGVWSVTAISDPSGKDVAGSNSIGFSTSPQMKVTSVIPGNYSIVMSNTRLNRDHSIAIPGDTSLMGGLSIYTLEVSCVLKGNKVVAPDPSKLDQALAPLTTETTTVAEATTSALANPTPAPTTAASTTNTEIVTCLASPATRLYVGAHGKVAPGDANNLRDEPSGKSIAKMPPGSEFDILEGPQCGRTGLTFWKVQYGDLVGWTAEGQGTEYWLEPVEDGRG